ncbi:MAG TPA: DUF763 domain-containing protein [Dehalococcoidia bacterium]|jgi:hypothetical protein|nr:DUF763 domain-containing protein [Dehalococcoidia bacterium]
MTTPTRTGIAHLPLHYGKAPPWLFRRMVKLAREITLAIVIDFGPEEMLRRLSHPYWFQAFGCILGFDWHSSGVTTTLCGALKEAIKGLERDLHLFVAGGKGKTSRQTPTEIENWAERTSLNPAPLVYASRMSAKVDSSAVQDGYQLYHHTFLFTSKGAWAVIQQGMNETNRYARRYHWLGEALSSFVNEPHSAVLSEARGEALNLVAGESDPARTTITEIATEEKPEKTLAHLKKLKSLNLPPRHQILASDLHPDSLIKILLSTYERQPQDFEQLLGLSGVGAKTIRALSLISELVYGVAPSYRDPARYSFAHGGKDGIPYPVDRKTYDQSIELLSQAINKAKLGLSEKKEALGRLNRVMTR